MKKIVCPYCGKDIFVKGPEPEEETFFGGKVRCEECKNMVNIEERLIAELPGNKLHKAVEELSENLHTQWDPLLLKILLKISSIIEKLEGFFKRIKFSK